MKREELSILEKRLKASEQRMLDFATEALKNLTSQVEELRETPHGTLKLLKPPDLT